MHPNTVADISEWKFTCEELPRRDPGAWRLQWAPSRETQLEQWSNRLAWTIDPCALNSKSYWPTVFCCGPIVLDDWSTPMMKDYWSTIFRGPNRLFISWINSPRGSTVWYSFGTPCSQWSCTVESDQVGYSCSPHPKTRLSPLSWLFCVRDWSHQSGRSLSLHQERGTACPLTLDWSRTPNFWKRIWKLFV